MPILNVLHNSHLVIGKNWSKICSFVVMQFWNTCLLLLLLAACSQPDTTRNMKYAVQGLDVSHHQQEIEWDSVKRQGFHFVFIKATEDTSFVDSNFIENYEGARATGMIVGAYHFFRPKSSGHKQAVHFMKNSMVQTGDLLPVLDIETTDNVSSATILAEIQEFVQTVEDSMHLKPIIYSNQKFFNEHLDESYADDLLWIARYNKDWIPELEESAEWHFWQYGQRGKIPGIKTFVDFNVFCCSSDELSLFLVAPDSLRKLPAENL